MSRSRPTIETLGILLAVFALQIVGGVLGWAGPFVLASPLATDPWTIVTHVYAHAGVGHLIANVLGLAILGPLVARRTTRARFHAYFLGTGALAGVAEVTLGSLVGPTTAVIGASGAIFALLGYLLAGNVISAKLLDWISLSRRATLVLFVVIAVLVTLATGSPRSALFGHATGLGIGLLAGRAQLLDGKVVGREHAGGRGESDRS